MVLELFGIKKHKKDIDIYTVLFREREQTANT